jgi:hypothetical protein
VQLSAHFAMRADGGASVHITGHAEGADFTDQADTFRLVADAAEVAIQDPTSVAGMRAPMTTTTNQRDRPVMGHSGTIGGSSHPPDRA